MLLLPVCGALLLLGGCGVDLEHGLEERQANRVAALLEHAGIRADKQPDTTGAYKISVARADVARAVSLLDRHDLPAATGKGLAETFADRSLIASPDEERARLQAALATELERTLAALPNVASARVHVALPMPDPLGVEPVHARPTAAALLKTRGPLTVTGEQLRRLIASAVPELAPADVELVATATPADEPAPPLEHVGPFAVAPGSRAALAALAGSGLSLLILLAVALVWASRRMGRLRRRVAELQPKR